MGEIVTIDSFEKAAPNRNENVVSIDEFEFIADERQTMPDPRDDLNFVERALTSSVGDALTGFVSKRGAAFSASTLKETPYGIGKRLLTQEPFMTKHEKELAAKYPITSGAGSMLGGLTSIIGILAIPGVGLPVGFGAAGALSKTADIAEDASKNFNDSLSTAKSIGQVAVTGIVQGITGKIFQNASVVPTLWGRAIMRSSGAGANAITETLVNQAISEEKVDVEKALANGGFAAVQMGLLHMLVEAPALKRAIIRDASKIAGKTLNYPEAKAVLKKSGINPESLSPELQKANYELKRKVALEDIKVKSSRLGVSEKVLRDVINERSIRGREEILSKYLSDMVRKDPKKAEKLLPFFDLIKKGADPVDVLIAIETTEMLKTPTPITEQLKTPSQKVGAKLEIGKTYNSKGKLIDSKAKKVTETIYKMRDGKRWEQSNDGVTWKPVQNEEVPFEVNAEETIGELTVAEPDLTEQAKGFDTVEEFVTEQKNKFTKTLKDYNEENEGEVWLRVLPEGSKLLKEGDFVPSSKEWEIVDGDTSNMRPTKTESGNVSATEVPINSHEITLEEVYDQISRYGEEQLILISGERTQNQEWNQDPWEVVIKDAKVEKILDKRILNSFVKRPYSPEIKQQLTDIYNKAHESKVVKPKPKPKQTRKQKFDEMVTRIQEIKKTRQDLKKSKVELQDASKGISEDLSSYNNALIKPTDEKLLEEYNKLPAKYKENKNNKGIIPFNEEVNNFLSDMILLQEQVKNDISETQTAIVEETQKKIVKSEVASLKQRLADFKAGKLEKISEIKDLRKDLKQRVRKELPGDIPKQIMTVIDSIVDEVTLQRAEAKLDDIVKNYEDNLAKVKAETAITKELKFTKPVKTKGKYDYESNKIFDELRDIQKMTKATAMEALSISPTENLTELDLIKQRILSLKANGKEASVAIYEQVLADIKLLKQQGKLAKSEEDMFKRVEGSENIEEARELLHKFKPEKHSNKKGKTKFINKVKTNIGNTYVEGFGILYSHFNWLFGQKFAEKHDGQINQIHQRTGTRVQIKKTNEKVMKIYDVKDQTAIDKVFNKTDLIKIEYNMLMEDLYLTDKNGREHDELNKFDLMSIYNAIKNDKTRAQYFNAFGSEQIFELLTNLTDAEKLHADTYMEDIKPYQDIYNQHSINTRGIDNGVVENYWPGASESEKDILDDYRNQSESPTAIKPRTASEDVIPVIKNAKDVFEKHVYVGEHLKHISPKYAKLRRMFDNPTLVTEIKSKYGESIYDSMMNHIEDLALYKPIQRIDSISKFFGKRISNWVIAKIAIPNITSPIKQQLSQLNFIEQMNVFEWVKYYKQGLKNPRKTFEYMWKEIPYLEARFMMGFNEALEEAIKGSSEIKSNIDLFATGLTSGTRMSDITAIIYGGYPLYQSELDKGTPKKEAEDIFLKATARHQQSPFELSRSKWQKNKNPLIKGSLAFANTISQHTRNMGDAYISYKHGDIDAVQLAKTFLIYGFIQALLVSLVTLAAKEGFYAVGRAFTGRRREEQTDDDLKTIGENVLIDMAISQVSAIPYIKDAVAYTIRRQTGRNAYNALSHNMFDDLEKGIQAINKKKENITMMDYLTISAILLETELGLPGQTILREKKLLLDAKKQK